MFISPDPSKKYKLYFACTMSVMNTAIFPDLLNILFQSNGVVNQEEIKDLEKKKEELLPTENQKSKQGWGFKNFCWSCSAPNEVGQNSVCIAVVNYYSNMFCKNCGVQVKSGSKFCQSCGQEIKVGRLTLLRARFFEWLKEHRKGLIIFAGVVLLFVIIGLYDNSSTNQTTSNYPAVQTTSL